MKDICMPHCVVTITTVQTLSDNGTTALPQRHKDIIDRELHAAIPKLPFL